MANWRKTRWPAIYVSHSKACPAYDNAAARCRCKPSWRGRAWDSAARKPIWQKATKSRPEVHAWLAAMGKGADHLAELAKVGPTSLGEQWLDGVERGHIGRRRGRGKAYSDTTIEGMRRSWRYQLLPEFGPRITEEITEIDWQRWIDQLAQDGLKRSTIASHVSVASGIYAWASAPSRRLVPRNPLRLVELPPNDETPRLRVALAPEAAALLAALNPEDRLPYAIAVYAGLRRSEIYRLAWDDVLEGDEIARRLLLSSVTRRDAAASSAIIDVGADDQPLLGDRDRDVLRRSRASALPCSTRQRSGEGADGHPRGDRKLARAAPTAPRTRMGRAASGRARRELAQSPGR